MGKNDNTSPDYKYLTAASIGDIVPLSQLDDNIYSSMVLGNGYAVKAEVDEVYSPVNGVVEKISNNSHSFNIKSDDGLNVLIHLGRDSDCDAHFNVTALVAEGDKVTQGQLICKPKCDKYDDCDCYLEVAVLNSDSLDTFEIVCSEAKKPLSPIVKYKN